MNDSETDFYKILGVDRNASADDIKKAFRHFSKQYHPDMQHGKSEAEKKAAEEMFKKGQAAYECLSDPEKRSAYDEYGIDGLRGHAQHSGFGDGMPDNLADFIRKHMRGFGFNPFGDEEEEQRRDPPSNLDPENGRTVRIQMKVNFDDVLYGAEKNFTMDKLDVCPVCHGHKCSGFAACSECHGTGIHQRVEGYTIFQSPCTRCNGSGFEMKDKCSNCNGTGRIQTSKEFKVKIPVGFPNGGILRVNGGGEAGLNGGKDGHLLIVVFSDNTDGVFTRQSDDSFNLETKLFIHPFMGVLGGKTIVLTPFGPEQIDIPPKTDNGKVITLRNNGIDHKGSLLAKVTYDMIDVDSITPDEKSYLDSVLQSTYNPKVYLKNFKEQLEKYENRNKQ